MRSRPAPKPVLRWLVRVYVYIYCLSYVLSFCSPHFKIVNCLHEWKLGFRSGVPFTGEQYESVHQAMIDLMNELERHNYHGPKFKKLLREIATDAKRSVEMVSMSSLY